MIHHTSRYRYFYFASTAMFTPTRGRLNWTFSSHRHRPMNNSVLFLFLEAIRLRRVRVRVKRITTTTTTTWTWHYHISFELLSNIGFHAIQCFNKIVAPLQLLLQNFSLLSYFSLLCLDVSQLFFHCDRKIIFRNGVYWYRCTVSPSCCRSRR